MAASKVAALLLLSCVALLLGGAEARMAIACSPYVYPCNCGLCPNIVNCETKQSAECFCGRNSTTPGVYPHPTDKAKYWMCSYDAKRKIAYGVEATCPYQLLWDAVLKVCTFPDVVSQQQQLQEQQQPAADAKAPAAPAGPTPAAATPAPTTTDKPAAASAGSNDKPAAKTAPATTSPATTSPAMTSPSSSTAPATTTAPTSSGKPDVTVAAADAGKALPASTKVADRQPYQAYKPRMP